jgi:hypothetical protein
MTDMYRVRVQFTGNWTVGGGVATHYFHEGAGTAADAVTAVAAFWGACGSAMTTAVQWATDADVPSIDDVTGAVTGINSVGIQTGAGLVATAAAAVATQALVRWRTGSVVGTRELRGRTFVPGMVVAQMANGQPTSALVTDLNAAAAGLINDVNSALVVWRRPAPDGSYAGTSRVVATGNCWTKYAVLRSRRD